MDINEIEVDFEEIDPKQLDLVDEINKIKNIVDINK